MANETAADVEFCIFDGHLRDHPDIPVTLTGGCPYDNTYEVFI
jgi:hypothetical protein